MHVAIIMDGNGRWAAARGEPRVAGHREGARRIREVVEAAPALGIDVLSLYAFSADNWKRPEAEVAALMSIFMRHLSEEERQLVTSGVRLTVVGRRDRLAHGLRHRIECVERATARGSRLWLRLAIDYSGREALSQAAARAWSLTEWTPEAFACRIGSGRGTPSATPDVDLLIRTGGEQRLSDFLLWECAYAELWFTKTAWPDFGARQLAQAMDAFHARERRFGALAAVADADTCGTGL
jgi:undecaprenyl diphosphate synthase